MPDYVDMSTTNLVDLLARETERFTQLLANKEFTQEYERTRETIQQLIAVLESRKEVNIAVPPAMLYDPKRNN